MPATLSYETGKLVASLIGWRYLPSYGASWLVTMVYSLYPRIFGRAPPPQGSPDHRKHVRWAYSTIIFGYAFATFSYAAASIAPNYYELMGVNPTADESDLKAAFRVFAKRYHPDRAGPQGEDFFMHIRAVFEALKDPTTRFAYDRFGPEVLEWKNTTTISECIAKWLWTLLPTYAISIIAVVFWHSLIPHSLVFWNLVLVLGTFALEVLFVLSPSPHASFSSDTASIPLPATLFTNPVDQTYANFFTYIWPGRVAYQHIILIRQLSIMLSSALQHVIPNLFPPSTPRDVTEELVMEHQRGLIKMMTQVDQEIDATLQASLHSAHGPPSNSTASSAEFSRITPLKIEPAVKELLRKELQDMILENVMMSQHGPLRSACESAIVRRRRAEQSQKEHEAGQSVAESSTPSEERRRPDMERSEEDRARETSGSSVATIVGVQPDTDNTDNKENVDMSAQHAFGDGTLDRCIANGSLAGSPVVLPGMPMSNIRARSQSL